MKVRNKIGNKYLFSNGRGNYFPVSIIYRESIKNIKKRLESGEYNTKNEIDWAKKEINSAKHGIGLKSLRKSLNSKLRHLAKKDIENELNEID